MRIALALALVCGASLVTPVAAETNAGSIPADRSNPFTVTPVATFDFPWAIAFLPSGDMLVTEKPGHLFVVSQKGRKVPVSGVPAVAYKGQGGLLDVAVSPTYAKDHAIYLSYAEPGRGGSGLALARASLIGDAKGMRLEGLKVLWRQLPRGEGGQFGGIITFDPSGRYLFLASGERQRFTPAQDPNQALGKILRLTLDGKPAPGNPWAGKTGSDTVVVTDPPANTGAAKTEKGRSVRLAAPNLTPAETWTTGHRNPYGLAFAPDGRLWEVEMGPMGGDELNLLTPGRNYGWPVVSNGINYDGTPIPPHDTHPQFVPPVVYWTPVIAPAGFAFSPGGVFPQWKGSAFIGGLESEALVRIAFDGKGGARQADRWKLGHRIRDVAIGPDGAIWLIEDERAGRLVKLTPKG